MCTRFLIGLSLDRNVSSDMADRSEDWTLAPCLHSDKSGHESFAQLSNCSNVVWLHYMPLMWQQSASVPPSVAPELLFPLLHLLMPVSRPPPPHPPLAPVRLVRDCHRTSCDKQANTHNHAAECSRAQARTHTAASRQPCKRQAPTHPFVILPSIDFHVG